MSTWRDDKSGKLLCELHQEKPLDPACAGYPYAIGTLALVKVRFHLLQGKIGTLKTPDPTARKELEHLGRFMFFGEFTHEGCQLAWKQTDFLLKEYDDGRFEEVARDLRTLELEHLGKLGVAVRAQAKKIGVSDAQYEADLEAAVQAYTQKLDDRERGKPAVPPSPKQTPTADELRAVHHAALNFVETVKRSGYVADEPKPEGVDIALALSSMLIAVRQLECALNPRLITLRGRRGLGLMRVTQVWPAIDGIQVADGLASLRNILDDIMCEWGIEPSAPNAASGGPSGKVPKMHRRRLDAIMDAARLIEQGITSAEPKEPDLEAMPGNVQYDVFLSYNAKDKSRVQRLAERLRDAGLRVWFDDWVIKPGDDIYLAIERGLEASRTLVLCLSPAALGSDWVKLERSTAMFRDPSNVSRRFIPLLLVECTLPDVLRRFKQVDYRQETDSAFSEVLIACRRDDQRTHQTQRDELLLERTYLPYRDKPCEAIHSPQLLKYLESRYCRPLVTIAGKQFPATVVWRNVRGLVHPDKLLGAFDPTEPVPLSSSATLDSADYAKARELIRERFETPEVPYEGTDYCMTRIDVSRNPAVVDGRFGLYYDNILTQYAIEWELRKALGQLSGGRLDLLSRPVALPLREFAERDRDPLLDGSSRCAAITVSTLVLFKRPTGALNCLIRRRSLTVGVSPGMLHVVPAGMFEALDTGDKWSVEMNVWRELLEEVYGEKGLQGEDKPQQPDHILAKEPIRTLLTLMKAGSAQLSATGIVCDLLNLRPEICTVLFVDDPSFAQAREMVLNWEYEPMKRSGKFAVAWTQVDDVVQRDAHAFGMVPSGAGCLSLGREWVRNMHGI